MDVTSFIFSCMLAAEIGNFLCGSVEKVTTQNLHTLRQSECIVNFLGQLSLMNELLCNAVLMYVVYHL